MLLPCPACGESVTTFQATDGSLRCPLCKLILSRPGSRGALAYVKPSSARPVSAGTPRFTRVLIAEDLELHRQIIANGLRERGIAQEVIETSEGASFVAAAIERFERLEPIDLAIVDVEMPGMSGREAALALRDAEKSRALPTMPILFFTAQVADEELRKELDGVGKASYLNKTGLGLEELFARLEQVLRTLHGGAALDDDAA